MAEIKNTYSLKDVIALKNPDGTLANVAEILMQSNSMIEDMPVMEGNVETGEQLTLRRSLGTPHWKRYNEPVKPSVSRTTQENEVTGHLEDWSEIDCDLADKAGASLGDFLLRESKPKMQAMSQEMAKTIVYGSLGADAKTFNGFMTRMNTLNGDYMNGEPIVIDAGGTNEGGLASVLLIGWSPETIYGLYPKGAQGGLQFEDKGKITKDTDTGLLDVYRSKFSWDMGLAVRDYRYAVRIANIDVEELQGLTPSTAASSPLYMKIIKAVGMIPAPQTVNLNFYAPRSVWIALSQIAAATGNRNVVKDINQAGLVSDIMGIPLKVQDAMLITESKVTE